MEEELKALVKSRTTEELKELVVFLEGVLTGRMENQLMLESTAKGMRDWKKPRKRSACSICKQSGHRAPNCPQKGTSVATREEL